MRTSYSNDPLNGTMVEERRKNKRYEIDCSVTVLTPGRGRKRTIAQGWLHDISETGARFLLDHPIQIGNRVTLDVHFSHPDGEVTTMRFQGIVKRVSSGESNETVVSFSRGGTFVRPAHARQKDAPRIQTAKSDWIN